MATFRILHISDLHLTAANLYPVPVFAPEVADGLARAIHQLRRDIDAIVISGDLANSGTLRNLDFARKTLTRLTSPAGPYRQHPRSGPTPRAGNLPIGLLPGNHDRFHNLRFGKPGCDRFDKVFASLWHGGVGGVDNTVIPSANEADDLAIIFADFTLKQARDAGPWPARFGQGKVYDNPLEELAYATWLAQNRDKPCAVLWVVHFAPELNTHVDFNFTLRLIEFERLISLAERCSVNHILCGHHHKNLQDFARGSATVRVYCAGTAAVRAKNDDTTIHVLEVVVEQGRVTKVARVSWDWYPDPGAFGLPKEPDRIDTPAVSFL